jgi:hypothetical protein
MKIILLYPNLRPPKDVKSINSFTSVWAYYLYDALDSLQCGIKRVIVPDLKGDALIKWYDELDIDGYDAIIALGLRYFSTVPVEIGNNLRKRFDGVVCQIYDGSRLDTDPVDLTFNIRDDSWRYPENSTANRYKRHHHNNAHVGWAADAELITPKQSTNVLQILVDHSTFCRGTCDRTLDLLIGIRDFVKSGKWETTYDAVVVKQLESGKIAEVDLDNIMVSVYDRQGIPYVDACKHYSQSHVFCVTHTESVGQTVIEAATAGALIVSPAGLINKDRIATVRSVEWDREVDWENVLSMIDIEASRNIAMSNSWTTIANRMIAAIKERRMAGG